MHRERFLEIYTLHCDYFNDKASIYSAAKYAKENENIVTVHIPRVSIENTVFQSLENFAIPTESKQAS